MYHCVKCEASKEFALRFLPDAPVLMILCLNCGYQFTVGAAAQVALNVSDPDVANRVAPEPDVRYRVKEPPAENWAAVATEELVEGIGRTFNSCFEENGRPGVVTANTRKVFMGGVENRLREYFAKLFEVAEEPEPERGDAP